MAAPSDCPAPRVTARVTTNVPTATARKKIVVTTEALWARRVLVILVTMSESLPLGDAKAHLSAVVSRVSEQHDRVTVTVHGRPAVVVMSLDDLESMEETIAILSDKDAVQQLVASDEELARGEGESEEELTKAMRRRGKSA